MDTILNILLFVLILGVLIFVHELGHFWVAKWTGMRVDEFAIGFPPRLWKKQKGETLYSVNAIPFGGYVRIHGENPEHQDDDPRSFEAKSVWARIAVVLAGVTMNLLFAFVVLVIAFSVGFVSISQDLTEIKGASTTKNQVLVADIQPDSGAAKAGLKQGDIITGFVDATDGSLDPVNTVTDLTSYTKDLQVAGVQSVTVLYDRNGSKERGTAAIAPEGPPLGVYIQPFQTVRVPVWRAPEVAVKEIWAIITVTWDALASFGKQLFNQGTLDPNVSGPVGIYQATGTAAQAGALSVVFLVVVLSINLALLNILPIPALDGGRFIFLVVEAIARKRIVNRRLEAAVTFAGFVLLIGLILVLSVRDVIRLF